MIEAILSLLGVRRVFPEPPPAHEPLTPPHVHEFLKEYLKKN